VIFHLFIYYFFNNQNQIPAREKKKERKKWDFEIRKNEGVSKWQVQNKPKRNQNF